jgi:hypothetical protein
MLSARRRTPPPRRPRRSRGEGTRSRRSGAHWVPGLKTGTTLGRSTLPPNRNPRAESTLGALAPATTSASAGSGHPTAPQTGKPRYSAVAEASAGLEPATPSLPWRSGHAAKASPDGQSRCTSRESGCRSTPQRPARFDILRYPLGTRATTAFRARARAFGRPPCLLMRAPAPPHREPPCP